MHVAGPPPVAPTGGPQADIVPLRAPVPQAQREDGQRAGGPSEQDRPKRRGRRAGSGRRPRQNKAA